MKKNLLQKNRKKTILTALALGLCLLTPWHRAEAVTSYTTPNGLFRLDYYGAGESFTGKWYLENLPEEEKVCLISQGELPDWQKQQINCAADYWDGLLKHTAFPRQPVILAITVSQGEDNVDYGSMTEVETDGKTISVTTPNAILNHGKVLTEEDGLLRIDAGGEEIDGDVERAFTQIFRIRHGGHRVVVGDEIEAFIAAVLQGDGGAHGAEIVADMEGSGWLDACKNSFAHIRDWWLVVSGREGCAPARPVV